MQSHLFDAFVRFRPAFRRLPLVAKVVVGFIGPVGTILGTLLALNVIHPFGDDALASAIKHIDASTAAIVLKFTPRDPAGKQTAFDATGEFDYSAGRGRLHYEFADAIGAGGRHDVEARFHGRQVYLELGSSKAKRPWVHADLAVAHQQLATFAAMAGRDAPLPDLTSLTELNFNDPSQVLRELKRADSFAALGHVRVLGFDTTRYRAVIKPSTRQGQRLTVNAFIDDDNLIRRLTVATEDRPAPFELTMDFRRFGTAVKAATPPADKVQELADLLRRLPP
jgi:hypothetical protein